MTRPAKAAAVKKRHPKTPRQRAEEQLGVAERLVARLSEKAAALRAEFFAVEEEQHAAVVRRDYLAQHPDLQAPEDIPLPLDGES